MIDIQKIRNAEISQDGKTVNLEGMPLLSTMFSTYRNNGGMEKFLRAINIKYLEKLEEYEKIQEDLYKNKKRKNNEYDNIALNIEGEEWLIDMDLLACTIHRKMYENGKDTQEFSYDELLKGPQYFRALLISEYGYRKGIFTTFDLGNDNWSGDGQITFVVDVHVLAKYRDIVRENPEKNILYSKLLNMAEESMYNNLKPIELSKEADKLGKKFKKHRGNRLKKKGKK